MTILPSKTPPNFDPEDAMRRRLAPAATIAGVDEAGRGPWAGPVVAAAVILDPRNVPDGLNDSKKLNAVTRENLDKSLRSTAKWAIGVADVDEIDRDNILQATLRAMERAVAALPRQPHGVLIDGNKAPKLSVPTQTLVKGDALSLSVAAASIIAKVARDKMMCDLAAEYPVFGWERNKGYGTKEHQQALIANGITPHHRRSFAPIHKMLF
jgi:ribonuclease HII